MPTFQACTLPSDTQLMAHELAIPAADTAESAAETIVRAACHKIPRLR